ncbi:alpha-amylase family protein [Rhodohalobacter mucosus]|uniref:Amylosucrase n=1 Tax=Rhodohalobacter mucosus TaxID=2079485 RepID=A0A316TVE3_9BACT|nr:alpha-amylase family protein [Rhodohalobacter mucosus]PWN07269.1 amylosucrase [Rhodohalobacter mucosus]
MYQPKTIPEIPLPDDIDRREQLTRERIFPRLTKSEAGGGKKAEIFYERLETEFPRLFRTLYHLYGNRYDFYYHLEDLLHRMAGIYSERSPELRARDLNKEKNPDWYKSEKMVGGICYVDLYAGDLKKLKKKIPYFKELGLTYMHLMPFFRCPEGESDGGYAVSSYRHVRKDLGTMDDLEELATAFHEHGINLVVDFINNHTSDRFKWAEEARRGDPDYMEHYYMFPDRTLPDQYDQTLRAIFPEVRHGNFTRVDEIDRWVWTTFHSYQWDLNYRNPAVFNAIAEELLVLANRGVDVLRMDAVAFTWKKMGTDCENLPEAHYILQALNAVASVVCPGLLLKSEAIVHPDEVNRYIGSVECQLSYNPLLMALSWESLATRETKLLAHSMKHRFQIDENCSWVNYVRCHDDIGWTFSDEDAAELGIHGNDHRSFLNRFYSGRFPGSFARGVPFQHNPENDDMRICGSAASLTGLEKGLEDNSSNDIDLSIKRIEMMYGVAYSIGGIPLLYLGDEWGVLNDYSYLETPGKVHDSRWAHRPDLRKGAKSDLVVNDVAKRLTAWFKKMGAIRSSEPVMGNTITRFPDQPDPHLFTFLRGQGAEKLLVIANFSEFERKLHNDWITDQLHAVSYRNLLNGEHRSVHNELHVDPYQILWLKPVSG